MGRLFGKTKSKYMNLPVAVRASLWFTVCNFFQKGVSFITVPIFTRLLSTEEYGVYSVYLSWQSIIIIFATLNLSSQVFNNGMTKYDNDRFGYTSAMLGLSNLCTLVFFSIYFILKEAINKALDVSTPMMIIMFVGFFFSAATSLWTVQQRYLFKYHALCIVTIMSTVGTAVVGVLLVINNPTGYSRVLADVLVASLVGICVYISIIKKNNKLFNVGYWKYALAIDLPLLAHYLSMTVLGSSDRIMINDICGEGHTALYSVPYNASMIMQIIITSINSSFIPWTYQKCKQREWTKLKDTSTILIAVVALISLVPSLFAPELVWILGSEKYAASVWVVPPVSCSVFFIFLYSLFSNIEIYYEKSKNIMIASMGAAIANILLNYIFINLFGYIAAAYTTLACYILLSLVHYVFMKKVLKKEDEKEVPYNIRLILLISFAVIFNSICVTLLYNQPWIIRYLIIMVVVLIIFIKRALIINKINELKISR